MGMKQSSEPPLRGLRVLDLSRILAGPTCTQLFGDMGAEVIKIERPGAGDDTRKWGPPFIQDESGNDTSESTYYLSANRNKYSVAIDISQPDGADLIRKLAAQSDIFVENFKVGDMKRRGLDYETLKEINPGLIYCSISGFGQTGPYAPRAGYDFLIQGMGGVMSITGEAQENGGRPVKVGVAAADVMCGMYASSAILAALHHRHMTGEGQYIDLALFDTQVAWLVNQATAYLNAGVVAPRRGNGHPTIVPYETFQALDGEFILAIGNDTQFQKFCAIANIPELSAHPDYVTNVERVKNRDRLVPLLNDVTRNRSKSDWIEDLSRAGVPCGPVNNLEEVFADPQVQHREMSISMAHEKAGSGNVHLIGNPINFSKTPVQYAKAPPSLGEDSDHILSSLLGLDEQQLDDLKNKKIVEQGG